MPRFRVQVEYVMQYVLEAADEAEVRDIVDDGVVDEVAGPGFTELYEGPTVLEIRPAPLEPARPVERPTG